MRHTSSPRPVAERLEQPVPRDATVRLPDGSLLTASDSGLELAGRRLELDTLVVQLSRCRLGRGEGVHASLRGEGLGALELVAPFSDTTLLAGLPRYDGTGHRVEDDALLAVVETALALGARTSRVVVGMEGAIAPVAEPALALPPRALRHSPWLALMLAFSALHALVFGLNELASGLPPVLGLVWVCLFELALRLRLGLPDAGPGPLRYDWLPQWYDNTRPSARGSAHTIESLPWLIASLVGAALGLCWMAVSTPTLDGDLIRSFLGAAVIVSCGQRTRREWPRAREYLALLRSRLAVEGLLASDSPVIAVRRACVWLRTEASNPDQKVFLQDIETELDLNPNVRLYIGGHERRIDTERLHWATTFWLRFDGPAPIKWRTEWHLHRGMPALYRDDTSVPLLVAAPQRPRAALRRRLAAWFVFGPLLLAISSLAVLKWFIIFL